MAKGKQQDPIPMLEWAAAAFGLLVALALLGIIGREAVIGDGGEVPVLVAHVEGIERAPGGYVARVIVTNRSGQTAAKVQLEGKAGSEVSVASIDYVPGHSKGEGGLVFRGDPRRSGLATRVTGYQLP